MMLMEDSAMKKCLLISAAVLICSGFVYAQSESEVRDRIIGTWKLVSITRFMKDGTTRPYPSYGPNGKGFLKTGDAARFCRRLFANAPPHDAKPCSVPVDRPIIWGTERISRR